MGTIIFEGLEPFGLIVAHTASAIAAGESVEPALYVPDHVPDPRQPQRHVPIRVPMPPSVALDLSIQLRDAALAAEKNARKQD
jgi:hypothetical protein